MSQDEFNMNTNVFPSQLTNSLIYENVDPQFIQENSKHQSSDTMNGSNERSNDTNNTIANFPSFSSPIAEPIHEEPPAKVEEPFITSPMPPEGIPTIQSQENFSQYYLHSNKEATQTQEGEKDNGSNGPISSNQDTQPKTGGSFQTEGQENIFLNGECFSVSPPKENYSSGQQSIVPHKKRGRKPGQKANPRKKIKNEEEEYKVEDDLEMVPETSSDEEDFEEDRESYVNDVKREEKGSTNERKEYTVYEDWRILEATDDYIEKNGPKGLQSIVKWKKLRDPLTGEKVLFETRSFESMRDRYKRYIMVFNKDDKATIRKFCREHSKEELFNHHCLFKKIDKSRRFIGISTELNYDPKRISRRTFYNTTYKDKRAKKKEIQEKQEGEVKIKKKRGRKKKQPQEPGVVLEQDKSEVEKYFDNNFEENDENTRENKLFVLARDDNYLENHHQMMTFGDHHPQQSQMMAKPFKVIHPSPPYNAQWQQESHHFISNVYPNPKNASFENHGGEMGENSMKDLYMFNNGSSQESKSKRPVNHNRSRSLHQHQRSGENLSYPRGRSTSTLKEICLDEDFKGAELKVSKAFKTKRQPNEKPLKDDIMIFADYQEKCRHFVKERREDSSHPKMVPNIFEKLARTYGLTINKLMDYYNLVSCNIADLEEYLQTKNGQILWTAEEDQFLLRNENIPWLKALKTERRVQERLSYLRD